MKAIQLLLLGTLCCALCSCKHSAGNPKGADTARRGASGDRGVAGAGHEEIDESDLQSLLANGYKLYWGIRDLGTSEKDIIDGKAVERIDPAKAPTLDALRNRFRPTFTERAIDSIFRDFGVITRGGKLWMLRSADADVADYDAASLTDSEADSTGMIATVEIPLGDSGQTDEIEVHLAMNGNRWRIDSDPFGRNDN
ncbi:MAG: DL-endopeptidase inhibitor IseA family protein [Bacteroidota bacterium]